MDLNEIISLDIWRTKNPQVFLFVFETENGNVYCNHIFLSYHKFNQINDITDKQQQIEAFKKSFKSFIKKTIDQKINILTTIF